MAKAKAKANACIHTYVFLVKRLTITITIIIHAIKYQNIFTIRRTQPIRKRVIGLTDINDVRSDTINDGNGNGEKKMRTMVHIQYRSSTHIHFYI